MTEANLPDLTDAWLVVIDPQRVFADPSSEWGSPMWDAALGPINLGHFLPDYTAYEELLDLFRLFNPIPRKSLGDHC